MSTPDATPTVPAARPVARQRAWLAPLLLCVGVVALTLAVDFGLEPTPAAPLTDTAALDGAERIGTWLAGVDRDSRRATELAWQQRAAQPPLVGALQGLSWWAVRELRGTHGAAALPNLLAGALALIAVAWLALRRFGWAGAAVAAGLLVFSPGYLAAWRGLDPAVLGGALLTLWVAAEWAGARRSSWLAAAVLLQALLVGAHAAGVWLVIPLLVYHAWPDRGPARGEGALRVPALSIHPFVGLGAGVLLLFALWPWLAGNPGETGKRAAEYFFGDFMAAHPPLLVWGHTFVQADGASPPLWTGPLVWLVRLPIPLLTLAAIGLVRAFRRTPPAQEASAATWRELRLPALFAGGIFLLHALNGSPWYDGTEALLVALPLLALLAAGGTRACLDHARGLKPRFVAVGTALLLLLAAVTRLGAGGAPGLWVNPVGGGAGDAAAGGLQLRATPALEGPVLDWMNESLPQNARVAFLPRSAEFAELARALRDGGLLREDLRFPADDAKDEDVLVLLHAPSAPDYAPATAAVHGLKLLHEVEHDGVPLARVFE